MTGRPAHSSLASPSVFNRLGQLSASAPRQDTQLGSGRHRTQPQSTDGQQRSRDPAEDQGEDRPQLLSIQLPVDGAALNPLSQDSPEG